jgi:hypothetical protein
MKNQNTTTYTAGGLDALQARFALRVTGRLNETTRDLPHNVTERLRFGREKALERARLARRTEVAAATQTVGRGASATLALGGPGSQRWFKWASILPVIALVAGFVLVERVHQKAQIAAAAEIDAALLADDVPPSAYSDPGFVEFLKAPRD